MRSSGRLTAGAAAAAAAVGISAGSVRGQELPSSAERQKTRTSRSKPVPGRAPLRRVIAVLALAGALGGGSVLAANPAAAAAAQRRPAASMPRGDSVDLGGLRLVRVHAPGRRSGPYLVQNVAHKLCLDAVKKHDGSNGDNVDLWGCNAGTNQYWYLNADGTITNAAHGLCLDAVKKHDGSDGDNVDLWACNGGSNQQWSSVATYEWANGAHGLCLSAVASGDGSNGDNVELLTCSLGFNQDWVHF